jgi:ribosomal-protein-serine acetyltransferase
VLRFFTPNDAPSLLAALEVDRGSFLPWLPWTADDNRTLPEVYFNIERFRRDRERAAPPANDFVIGVFDRVSGEVVGGTGIHRIVPAWHEGEIGYWIRADRRGTGLCTEATAATISWAFTPADAWGWGLRRIHIKCAAANAASRRVPEKLGLRLESHIREERWIAGHGWADFLGFGVLAHEWDAEAGRVRSTPASA